LFKGGIRGTPKKFKNLKAQTTIFILIEKQVILE
jgi:hypothetical protein